MDASSLPMLLGVAVLLPLVSFFVIFAAGRWMPAGKVGGYVATGAIVLAGVLSFCSLLIWLDQPRCTGRTSSRPHTRWPEPLAARSPATRTRRSLGQPGRGATDCAPRMRQRSTRRRRAGRRTPATTICWASSASCG